MYFELMFVATTLFETSLSQSGDVVIVVDDSKNITDADWMTLQYFTVSLIEYFRYCSRSEIHAGVVMSNKLIGNLTRLIPTRSNETLLYSVDVLEKPKFKTDLASEIKTARLILNKHKRKGAMPLMVVITDGYLEQPDKATREVRMTKFRRITMIAIGFGQNVSLGGLEKIASSSEHVFRVYNSTHFEDELIAANANITGYFICGTIFESAQYRFPFIWFSKAIIRMTSGFPFG